MKTTWPKTIRTWRDHETGYMSVPFTWLLPQARTRLRQRDLFAKHWVVGGPAVQLMPDYLADCDVEVRDEMPGVLQIVNPYATRTTRGCSRRCSFCGVGRGLIEPGGLRELDDWPDRPVVCDNNLLAASQLHFDRVIDRLIPWGWCDFNQGLDAALLTSYHARRIAEISRALVRLACDTDDERDVWAGAVGDLISAGVARRRIRTLVLIGLEGEPVDDWLRCRFVESFGLRPSPMWYHPLDAMQRDPLSDEQRARGWSDAKRREIMGFYYQHRGTPLVPKTDRSPLTTTHYRP